MTFKGQQSIVAHHAAAVVGDANQLAPATLDRDHNAACARVQRVLEQLLDYRCGAVDDLAGGNLVGHLVSQYVDAAHDGNFPLLKLAGTATPVWCPDAGAKTCAQHGTARLPHSQNRNKTKTTP